MSHAVISRIGATALHALFLLLAFSSAALAAPDSFGTGTGVSGAYTAPMGSTTSTINSYSTLSANVLSGATTTTVATPGSFTNGRLLMIIQVKDGTFTSGDVNNVALSTTTAGRYNLARITNIAGNTLTFSP